MKTIPIIDNNDDNVISDSENYKPFFTFFDESFVCFKESDTIVCGKLEAFDYKELEDKFTFEPFFGECDLFGF
jgi:hypothetical protein